jgi:hypothetical protein
MPKPRWQSCSQVIIYQNIGLHGWTIWAQWSYKLWSEDVGFYSQQISTNMFGPDLTPTRWIGTTYYSLHLVIRCRMPISLFTHSHGPSSWNNNGYFCAQDLTLERTLHLANTVHLCFSSAGVLTGHGLVARQRRTDFSSPPNRLWGPPSVLSKGYRRLFSWGKAAGA